MKKATKYLAVALVIALALSLAGCGLRSALYAALPDDEAKEKAAELVAASDPADVTADDVARDIMLLRSVGMYTGDLLDFTVEDGRIIYREQTTPEIETLLTVEQDGGDVIVECWEGDIHDVITYKSNGDILLNGNKLKFN